MYIQTAFLKQAQIRLKVDAYHNALHMLIAAEQEIVVVALVVS